VVASAKPSSRDQAIAPQSLTVAVRTARSVVPTTAMFGYDAATCSIIALKPSVLSSVRSGSTPGTSKPRPAVKSSSLPIITSTSGASAELTSWARASPPMSCHRLGR